MSVKSVPKKLIIESQAVESGDTRVRLGKQPIDRDKRLEFVHPFPIDPLWRETRHRTRERIG